MINSRKITVLALTISFAFACGAGEGPPDSGRRGGGGGGSGGSGPGQGGAAGDAAGGTAGDAGVSAGSDGRQGGSGGSISDAGGRLDGPPLDASTGAPEVRPTACDNLPAGPFPMTEVPGIQPAEDITFDDAGHLYWNQDTGGIMKSTADGKSTLFVPGVQFAAGMRMTSTGDLYFVDNEKGLTRVAPNGTRMVVLSQFQLNGVEVDPQGRVYVTHLDGSTVYRYDPRTNTTTTVSKGVITTMPNGLTFNPNFDILYVGNYGGTRTLFQVPFNADGSPGATKPWVTGVGSGIFDGMAADECGNVYVADTGAGAKILRISPDGKQVKTVIIGRGDAILHNFVWGRGKGWSEDKLYIVSLGQGLFEANVGARGKKYW